MSHRDRGKCRRLWLSGAGESCKFVYRNNALSHKHGHGYILTARSLNELVITETELKLIAPAQIGKSSPVVVIRPLKREEQLTWAQGSLNDLFAISLIRQRFARLISWRTTVDTSVRGLGLM